MAIPAWADQALPQVPQKGFTESIGMNIIRSPVDSGPAKQRPRSIGTNTMELSFIMTTAQTTALELFIKNTLNGVKRFTFPHPRTNQNVEVRIVPNSDEFFKLQYLAPGYWQTSLKFEILP